MMVRTASAMSDAALVQQRLWGSDPAGWARFAEEHNRPLFEAVLDAAGVGTGSHVLDVGCGTGMTLSLARDRGALASGVDITAGLLEIAEQRLPDADLWLADMEHLPFPDGSFDVVVGVNSFQFAGDPLRALSEAARVCRPGGAVVASLFAEPERSQSTALHEAMAALSPPARQADHEPYALSYAGNLDAAMAAAGLQPSESGEVQCVWRYGSVDDALRGLLSSAGGTRAVQDVGEQRVRRALAGALARFTSPASGVIEMRNTFRWSLARRR